MRINKEVNNITAHSDIGVTEAYTTAKVNLGILNSSNTNKNNIAATSIKDFPRLPPTALIKDLQLRQIGGINRDFANSTNQWLNNNHKTYFRNLPNNIRRTVSSDSISIPGSSGSTLPNITPKLSTATNKPSTTPKQTDSSPNRKPDTTCTTILLKLYPLRSPRNPHTN